MIVDRLELPGAALLRGEQHDDERGGFRRVVDVGELSEHGLDGRIAQVSMATNHRRGTVRGLHYQVAPDEEAKTLWCSSGAVFDVLVDVRPDERTYGQWVSVRLSAEEPIALYVPPGVAHGYQTLEDATSLTYVISAAFTPQSARSLLWRDGTLGIDWPLPVSSISARDREAPPWPPGS